MLRVDEVLGAAIDFEGVVLCEEGADRGRGPGLRYPIDLRVLDDEELARAHEVSICPEVRGDLADAVVRVLDDHHGRRGADRVADLRDDVGAARRAVDELDGAAPPAIRGSKFSSMSR